MSNESEFDRWISDAITAEEKIRKMRRIQRAQAVELFERLTMEENPGMINYEIMLVSKVIDRSPLKRDDYVFTDKDGNPYIQFYCSVDTNYSGSTQNGFDEIDKLVSLASGRLIKKLNADEEDQEEDSTDQRIGLYKNSLYHPLYEEIGADLQDWDIVIRAIDGHPHQLNRILIDQVIIRSQDPASSVEFVLGYLKGKIDMYLGKHTTL